MKQNIDKIIEIFEKFDEEYGDGDIEYKIMDCPLKEWNKFYLSIQKEFEELKLDKQIALQEMTDINANLRTNIIDLKGKLKEKDKEWTEKIEKQIIKFEDFNPKPLTEVFLNEKHIIEWKLINNGLLGYSDWMIKSIMKILRKSLLESEVK